MANPATGCLICNAPLQFHMTLTDRLCGKEECRRKFAAFPKESLCSVCSRPLTPIQLPTKVCGDLQCQQILLGRIRDAEEKRRLEHMTKAARKLRSKSAATVHEPNPRRYAIAILPSFTNPITPLPGDRKAAFREHLQKVIDEVRNGSEGQTIEAPSFDSDVPASPETKMLPIIAGSGCATCGGYCCRNGGTHAFVSADTVRRFLVANPDKTPDDAFGEFMSFVPEMTYDNSCVYHSTEGCAIPMPYRSKICNDFFCFPLQDLAAMTADKKDPKVFLVSGNHWEIEHAAFVDVEGRRPVEIEK